MVKSLYFILVSAATIIGANAAAINQVKRQEFENIPWESTVHVEEGSTLWGYIEPDFGEASASDAFDMAGFSFDAAML